MKKLIVLISLFASSFALAETPYVDFNPFAKDAEMQIEKMDARYRKETGLDPFMAHQSYFESLDTSACYRIACHVFIEVSRQRQELKLYVDGQLMITTRTSTGRAGYGTPNFDTNPNGRIYQIYSSTKYPGYNNMPYAIFIQGGFAIHGAPGSEDAQLGRPASHGCVRVRTSVVKEINAIVLQAFKDAGGSTKTVWITVNN